jgi:hypothetical protein
VALDAQFSLACVPLTPLLAVIVVLRYVDRRVANESASFRPAERSSQVIGHPLLFLTTTGGDGLQDRGISRTV